MKRVECLDGLRGLAALWVLLGHAMILTGFRLPLISKPDLGVDLFILLSGFLMVFQYRLRSRFEDWHHPRVWISFWVRRLFRIAPLFYVTLAAALIAGPLLYADRVAIDTFLGQPLQDPERYLDASLANIAMHLTFLFGLFPAYAFRTPLPDWSLGLEMQFYLAFPLLILIAGRIGWMTMALVAALCAIMIAEAAGYVGLDYPMPSFLPLKMHLFLCGMLIAADTKGSRARLQLHFLTASLLALVPLGGATDFLHLAVREAIVMAFFALIHMRNFTAVDVAANLLGSRPLHWMGELSYGAYLIHLLVLQPLAAAAITQFGTDIGAAARFTLVTVILIPVTYGLAYVTYRLVELPGQRLGKTILARATGKKAPARQVLPEELAAP